MVENNSFSSFLRTRLLMRFLASLFIAAVFFVGGCGNGHQSTANKSASNVTLPQYYMNGMVFQSGKPFIVKGKANPGASLTISIGAQSASTTAGADGTFRAKVPASPASLDPYELTVTSGGRVVKDVKRVYSGELSLAAGQSNMEASYDLYYKDDKDASINMKNVITRSDLPSLTKDANIHYIKTDQQSSDSPTTNLPLRYSTDSWLDASSSSNKMSYTAYYAAIAMRRKHPNVPVGVIDVSWGGTNISTQLGKIWNNHMNPLSGFNVGGVVWYQGESDSSYNIPSWMREQFYLNNNGKDLPGLIDKFRTLVGDEKLPFVVVQLTRSDLTNFFYSPIRDAQSKTVMQKENTVLVSTLDTDKGTSELIHPLGKDIIGTRAGEILSSMIAGDTPSQGPIPSQATTNGTTVTVTFKGDTGKGLKAMSPIYNRTATSSHYATADTSSDIDEVEVAGSDGVFQPAKARVSGDTLIVSAQGIKGSPTQVRYAWNNQPAHPNLYNGKNLPAGTFVMDIDGATVNPKPRSVLFNDDGGAGTVTPISGDAGTQAQIPAKVPVRTKYTFKEWNTQANGSGTAYHPGDAITIPDKNLTTLYAIWTN